MQSKRMGEKLKMTVWTKNIHLPLVEVGLNLQIPLEISWTIDWLGPTLVPTKKVNFNFELIFKNQFFREGNLKLPSLENFVWKEAAIDFLGLAPPPPTLFFSLCTARLLLRLLLWLQVGLLFVPSSEAPTFVERPILPVRRDFMDWFKIQNSSMSNEITDVNHL